ncbi:MAG: MtrAB system histidine kinase MtrB [Actinomycetaceae bacterium]|nr:MtrAB system histidine kinase MtrB [Actinomycetaceae bacterium]
MLDRFTKRLVAWAPIRVFQRNLAVSITVILVAIAALMMVLLSLFVTSHVRDGLFQSRLEQILADASRRSASVQSTFDETTATEPSALQNVAYQLMQRERQNASGAGVVGVLLLGSSSNPEGPAINDVVDTAVQSVVTPAMRKEVTKGGRQQWQSVSVQIGNTHEPGVVVGQMVNLPVVGAHEFYLVYSLAPEQGTIDMIVQVLGVGTLVILMLLTVTIAGVSYQLVTPVQRAAAAAAELGEGSLSTRIPVQGKNELASLAVSFNKMADSLQKQIADYETLADLQRRFVSDVSHELRTPLTTIRMSAEVIYDARAELDALSARSAVILHEQVDRFDRMLSDLLEISRIDANTAISTREQVDIVQIAKRVIESNQTLAENNHVEVTLEAPGPVIAEADEIRVERIIRNIYVNALEHAEGGPVKVQIARSKTAVAVRVRDWGIGMRDEVAARVFDRFYRADPARARTSGGTGLGLAIAAEDAHIHQGLLTVIGCPGEGSAFMLALPIKFNEPIEDLPLQVSDAGLEEARARYAGTNPGGGVK